MDAELPLVFNDTRHTHSAELEVSEFFEHRKHLSSLSQSRLPKPDDSEPRSAVELTLQYLQWLLSSNDPKSANAIEPLLMAFDQDFLRDTDIHSLLIKLQVSSVLRRELLNTYYTAVSACNVSEPRDSALLKAAEHGQAQLFAIFEGQGTANAKCVKELVDLYATYMPLLEDLINATAPLINQLSRLPETRDHYYGRHLDLKTWLLNPATIPDGDFISTAAVSFPIIGILSLAHYCVSCKVLGKTPGELRSLLQGVTGHSQGIVVAAGIALSDSWESFYDIGRLVVEMLFWIGYECHQGSPRSSVSPALIKESLEKGEGRPSCMLSVRGLDRFQVDAILVKLNKSLAIQEQLYLALSNARDNFVIAGPANSLVHLNSHLRTLKANVDLDQGRIPFSSRTPTIHHHFLPISAPFHTSYLKDAAKNVKHQLSTKSISAGQLMIPLYHSRTGNDLKETGCPNLIDVLVDAITCEHCDWPAALEFPNASHIAAFGGKGIGELVMKVKEGQGARVIIASDIESRDKDMGTMTDLFSPQLLESSMKVESWGTKFQPRLMQSATGLSMMETKLSRLLGTPPVMVAGMTPTTVHWDFVSAIMNAGYHVELAGGGYYNADAMSAAIEKLVASVPAGKGVTCNLIYASPQAMAWQIAMLRKLAQNGVPVDGLTIGAGVPSPDVVAQYINTLGLRHISLKPGSYAAIREVIDIAKANPEFPIILQWTGGRGGGHHSYEDFHAPILRMYGAIRKCSNIVLVAGSGFGSSEDTYPYLTGTWANRFSFPLMPFDGVLLGSRMMVAREAHTSPASRKLIYQTPGVSDSDWEKSYTASAGGVVTVQSEMGQPIHKIATRGVLLWAEMDKTIFSLSRTDRRAKLTEKRDYIIRRLNADFSKPWFGQNSDGQAVDISEMTYAEVLRRLVNLMYVSNQRRWIDNSYVEFVMDFTSRLLERLPTKYEIAVSASKLEQPYQLLEDLLSACPKASSHILNPEDVSYFLLRCKARGQKPVNFVPNLDDDFELYFKKDSLWQSEDVDAVIGQDAGRVCILHGPVAAQYSKDRDESAKDILDGITKAHVDMIRRDFYAGEATPSSERGSLSPDSWSLVTPCSSVTTPMKDSPGLKSPTIPSRVCSEADAQLVSMFGVGKPSNSSAWIRALFSDEFVLQGRDRKSSPFRRVLEPRPGTSLQFDRGNSGLSLSAEHSTGAKSFLKVISQDDVNISVELHHPSAYSSETVVLPLKFRFNQNLTPFGLSEIMNQRNARTKSFYSKLWFDEDVDRNLDVNSTFYGKETTLTQEMHQDLVSTVGLSYSNSETMFSNSDLFPISVGIIVSWDIMTKPLVLKDIDGDLLRLVHLSNTFEYCEGASTLRVRDVVTSQSHVKAVRIEEAGKYVVIQAQIERLGKPVMIVTSTFLFKGRYDDFSSTFRHAREPDMVLEVTSAHDEAILRDREWFLLYDSSLSLVGMSLLFRLQTRITWKNSKVFRDMHVKGTVLAKLANDELHEIGTVDFQGGECFGNPVMDFLERKGISTIARSDLKNPGWSGDSSFEVQVPNSNEMYARVSKDYNPIHVSPIFAYWAELPGTITHGMYTSAIAAGVLEHLAANGDRLRFRQLSATFTGMVLPADRLSIRLRHTGMVQGRMLFKLSAFKKDTDDKVLDADAEIEQATTAYIFTGQGSQSQGMGMDLYNTSPVAKAIWDDVDKHLYDSYGTFIEILNC